MYITLPDGINVFYREAGSTTAPTILLLHGFPSSSFQFRKLIPILAEKYHVIAPDFPGFGFTEVPASLKYKYTFANLASTVSQFVSAKHLTKFAIYIFDYGAPVGLRLALDHPSAITAIISQNGNAYDEGFGDFWSIFRTYWKTSPGSADYEKSRADITAGVLSDETTKQQYVGGTPASHLDHVDPATYTLDSALMARPGNQDIQLDIFYDYQDNVTLYPKFQEYFRNSHIPLLAVWGKNDVIFIPPGAEAFKRDLPHAQVELLDAGHFVVESHTEEMGKKILDFLAEKGIK